MKILYCCTCLCVLMFSCGNGQETQNMPNDFIKSRLESMNMARPTDSYNYPVYPGTKKWQELNSVQEMKAACQIPSNLVVTMSTQALIQAILEHPMLYDVFHRYQYQKDFESLFLENNAYNELQIREDVATALVERMAVVLPLTQGAEMVSQAMELLTSQHTFLDNMNEDFTRQVVEVTLCNDRLRQESNIAHRATAWILIGKAMIEVAYSPFVKEVDNNKQLTQFLNDNEYVYTPESQDNIPTIILNFGTDYLNAH